MTMTDRPTTTELPEWLNIVALLSQDQLDAIPLLAREAETLREQLDDFASRAYLVRHAFDERTKALGLNEHDIATEVIMPAIGLDQLIEKLHALAELFLAAAGAPSVDVSYPPEWFVDVEEVQS